MAEQFDEVVRPVIERGGVAYYELSPSDFGEPGCCREMFIACLRVVLQRYPELQIDISASPVALAEMGLAAGADLLIHSQFASVRIGETDRPNSVRLTFFRDMKKVKHARQVS